MPEPPTELRDRLTPLQFEVTQNAGTERAFTGEYWDNHDPAPTSASLRQPLFRSEAKFDSGTRLAELLGGVDPAKVESSRTARTS